MNADGAVKHRLGRARFHRHGKALHDFARVGADHVQADDAVGRVFDDQLHQGALGAAAERVLERLEVAFIDADLAELLDGLGFAVADGADVRVGEHRCRNEVVTDAARRLARRRAEQRIDHHHRLGQRHRRELHSRRHVADGVNRGHRSLVLIVDFDRASGSLLHADGFQPQAVGQRHAARGVKHGIDADMAAVEQLDAHAFGAAFKGNRGHVGVQAQGHAALDHFAGNEGAHVLIKAAQNLLAPVQLRDLAAQPVEDGGEFAGDVAAAHDQQALRKRRQVKHFIRGDDMLAPRQVGHAGLAASGDQDILGAVLVAADFHRVLTHQHGPAVEQVNARAFEQQRINAVEPGNLSGAVRLERLPVQRRRLADPAKAVRFFKTFGEMGRVAVELFRDAAEVDTGAAHFRHFGQRHAGAALRGHAGSAHAAAAPANDEQVEIKSLHAWVSF